MIKQSWVAVCDVCGHTEAAKQRGGKYNETDWVAPDGWQYGHNQQIHLCPACAAVLKERTQKHD